MIEFVLATLSIIFLLFVTGALVFILYYRIFILPEEERKKKEEFDRLKNISTELYKKLYKAIETGRFYHNSKQVYHNTINNIYSNYDMFETIESLERTIKRLEQYGFDKGFDEFKYVERNNKIDDFLT